MSSRSGTLPRKKTFRKSFWRPFFSTSSARDIVSSLRGANGGYQLKRSPKKISLGEVIRRIDGPLAPFEDAESLRQRIHDDPKHRPLFRLLLDVRNATAGILDHTSAFRPLLSQPQLSFPPP